MKTLHFLCPVAVHLILIERGNILLLKRFNTGYEDGNYSVPAGCLDGEEPIRQAMAREAKEEAGITIQPDWLSVTSILHRKKTECNWESMVFFLRAHQYEGTIENREPHKCEELTWFPLTKLPQNTIPYVRRGIQNGLEGRFFEEFGWFNP